MRKITDAQLIAAAYNYGRSVINIIGDTLPAMWDSTHLIKRISQITHDTLLRIPKEKNIWDAYQYNLANGIESKDNVQLIGKNDVLYTHPMKPTQKGVQPMLSILMDKKGLVLAVK